MRKSLGVVAIAVLVLGTACAKKSETGADGGSALCAKDGPTITLGGFGFTESTTLVEIYGQALAARGCKVEKKTNLGTREIVQPALAKGDIDFVPEYLATLLEFDNGGAGEATSDTAATLTKLRARMQPKGLVALEPAPGQNRNEFVVTKETAAKHKLETISDLAPVASQLVLGGPPECPTRPLCAVGLKKTYGLTFKSFKKLDAGGPLTIAALDGKQVDVALLFTTTGAIAAKGFVVLDDDKGLQGADNIVPVVRKEIVDAHGDDLADFVNEISNKLTNEELQQLNKQTDIDKDDPEDVASAWLKEADLL